MAEGLSVETDGTVLLVSHGETKRTVPQFRAGTMGPVFVAGKATSGMPLSAMIIMQDGSCGEQKETHNTGEERP